MFFYVQGLKVVQTSGYASSIKSWSNFLATFLKYLDFKICIRKGRVRKEGKKSGKPRQEKLARNTKIFFFLGGVLSNVRYWSCLKSHISCCYAQKCIFMWKQAISSKKFFFPSKTYLRHSNIEFHLGDNAVKAVATPKSRHFKEPFLTCESSIAVSGCPNYRSTRISW